MNLRHHQQPESFPNQRNVKIIYKQKYDFEILNIHLTIIDFKCGKCEMSFELGRELSRHMQKPCDSYVSYPIPTLSSEEDQTNQEIGCEPLNCKCGISFSTPNLLSRHVQLYGCTGSFECYICHQSKYLKSVEAVRRHLERYHSKYSKSTEAMRHHLKQSENKWKKCKICKWRYGPNKLDHHLCGNEKSVQCDYCHKEFTATTKLLQHLERDHDEKKFIRCKKCSRFYAMQFLTDMCLASHVEIPKKYTCETCSKSFASRHNLSAHMKTHTSNIERSKIEFIFNIENGFQIFFLLIFIQAYLCDECGKDFSTERHLEIHKMSGSHQEPAFQCPDCPKKLYSSGQLRRHSDMHQNNKYLCDICNSEFPSLLRYNDHRR